LVTLENYSEESEDTNNEIKAPVIKLSSLKGSSKSFTAKWKKNSTVAGYEIRYSRKSGFESFKVVNVSNKKKSLKVKGLKGKKTYYVQIRTYIEEDGQKLYSDWSEAKKVKTLK